MRRLFLIIFVSFFSVFLYAQIPNSVYGVKLPYTWEMPMGNIGKMVCTLNTDGTISSYMLTMCYGCSGLGLCGVCGGTGGQYWYGIGIMSCGSCWGSGKCRGCSGKGYSITQTRRTSSGLTIGWDERGNYYVAGDGSSSSNTRTIRDGIYNCCSGIPTFGNVIYHKCENCESVHRIGDHKCIKK